MSKWDQWYDSLPEHTKRYIADQPLWHDIDLAKAAAVGFVVGFLFGLCF
jgi:ElaB/YqjD/DUF883 family membrane-anchored ribosome-binding protein